MSLCGRNGKSVCVCLRERREKRETFFVSCLWIPSFFKGTHCMAIVGETGSLPNAAPDHGCLCSVPRAELDPWRTHLFGHCRPNSAGTQSRCSTPGRFPDCWKCALRFLPSSSALGPCHVGWSSYVTRIPIRLLVCDYLLIHCPQKKTTKDWWWEAVKDHFTPSVFPYGKQRTATFFSESNSSYRLLV